jgi:hypothetical protein
VSQRVIARYWIASNDFLTSSKKSKSMTITQFAKKTLLLACLAGSNFVTSSANAQVYTDGAAKELAERKGLAKEFEAKQRLMAQFQVAPSKIELRKLDSGKCFLAPYCTIELGEHSSKTEWLVNKLPPVFIATVKDSGSIIFTVLPKQGPEFTNANLYKSAVEKIKGKMKSLDASPYFELSETQGEGTISGEHANGNKFQAYLRFDSRPDFAMMIQGFGRTPEELKVVKQILDSIKFD